MSQNFVMPDVRSVATLLKMFLGEDLVVTDHESTDLSSHHVATYINDSDDLVALCACDYPFVAYTGAALSMVPAAIANEAVADQKLTDAMVDNFHEVMNICSKLLMSNTSSHLRLDKTLNPDQSAGSISTLQESSCQSLAFSIDIPGYGTGSVTFLVS